MKPHRHSSARLLGRVLLAASYTTLALAPSPNSFRGVATIFNLPHRTPSGVAESVRGNNYINSTVLSPVQAAASVGVCPTAEASKETWQRAWKWHKFLMKQVLHRFDRCGTKDSKLALACLWWKALSGNDVSSPVYDHRLSYDLLPPVTRWIVHTRLCRWYPRLHHANVEIRTAYLDKAVSKVIATICNASLVPKKIRLIVMGGGYDTRSFKLLEHYMCNDEYLPPNTLLENRRKKDAMQRLPCFIQRGNKSDAMPASLSPFDILPCSSKYDLECVELDLPEVVRTKRELFHSRLFHRRPWLTQGAFVAPTLIEADLNNLTETRSALDSILSEGGVANIFLFEGVMIYLEEGIPHSLLQMCSDLGQQRGGWDTESFLCFADRFENIPGGDIELARMEMESTGWFLEDWLPKPGLARHMGIASLRKT